MKQMETTVKLYSPSCREARTYIMAAIFVMGNILLPQLCHTVPQGGLIFLPIYFFTLVGAYKYGLHVGLLTATLSPLLNHLLFGMPPAAALLPILVKSVALALAASVIARRNGTITLLSVTATVAIYQLTGSLFEWAITGSLTAAIQDLRIGLPGIILQIVGGYAVIRYLMK